MLRQSSQWGFWVYRGLEMFKLKQGRSAELF